MKKYMLWAVCCVLTHVVQAHEYASGRADGHGPIGVMGDHTHNENEWMFSYRFMTMEMDGLRNGSDDISTEDFFANTGYMVAPLDMTMDMHMFGMMYAPSDKITLLGMVNYLDYSMDHVTRSMINFTTESSGLGDIKLGALYQVLKTIDTRAHFNFGLSLPTGSIDERGDTPAAQNVILPYPMQLGSGTYDLSLGGTLVRQWQSWSLGGQWVSTFRLGENDRDYSLGDKHELNAWGAQALTDQISVSLRASYLDWGNYSGADEDLNPMMVPTADAGLRGGSRLDLGAGVNFVAESGLRLALEYLVPVQQDLDGPQLKVENTLVLGAQFAF